MRKKSAPESIAEITPRQLTDDFAFRPGSRTELMRVQTLRLKGDRPGVVKINRDNPIGTTYMSPYAEGAIAVRLGHILEDHTRKFQAYELGRQDGRLVVTKRHNLVESLGGVLEMPVSQYVKGVAPESLANRQVPSEHAESLRLDDLSAGQLLELSFVPDVLEAIDDYDFLHRLGPQTGLGGVALQA